LASEAVEERKYLFFLIFRIMKDKHIIFWFQSSQHPLCEPTTHRLLLKVSRPPQLHPPECRAGPTLPGSVRVGSSVPSPSQALPGEGRQTPVTRRPSACFPGNS
jgi:hypothetical protein